MTLPSINPRVSPPALTQSNAGGLVTNGWTSAQNYASAAVASAYTFLNGISAQASALSTMPIISDALGAITTVIGAYNAPALPVAPANLNFVPPIGPGAPVIPAIAALTLDTAPIFTAAVPTVDLGFAAPTALSATAPVAPLLGNITVPTAPTLVLPTVPTLLGITVPTAPLLNLPTFSQAGAVAPNGANNTFTFSETGYTSTLLTDLRARLLEWVDGTTATGLAPAVEAALWNRGRAREIINAGRKAQEAMRAFASRGFIKPSGALAVELAQANQASADAASTMNRDITIKQADLEQSNRHFAFDEAFKVESMLVGYANQMAQRSFDAAKYAQDVALDLYRIAAEVYRTDVQSYSAKIEAFKATLQGELSKLEAFKALIESQKLIGELNQQTVEIYRAQVQAVQATIDIFKAQVEATNAQAGINKIQIESFAAQISAYGETVRAKASEYEMYATRVKTEVAKVDIFKIQADAYGAQVQGFKALVDARVAQKGVEIKVLQDAPMDLFKARTEIFRIQTDAERTRVNTIGETFGRQVQAYTAAVGGETGRMGAQAEAYRAETGYLSSAAGVRIEVAKSNIQELIQKVSVLVEAAKSGAQVSAQMAASALSAVNLSGSLSESRQFSESSSFSSSESFGTTVSDTASTAPAGISYSDSTNHTN